MKSCSHKLYCCSKILLSLIIMLILLEVRSAATNLNFQVRFNDKNVEVSSVQVLLDGKELKSPVQSFSYIDRTMVPVRFISENYGASVEWDGSTGTVTITDAHRKIVLGVNRNTVHVDGEGHELDENSIPRLVTFSNGDTRTMVPLRFISQIMGYDVGWVAESRTAVITSKKHTGTEPNDVDSSETTSEDQDDVLYLPLPEQGDSPDVHEGQAILNDINLNTTFHGNEKLLFSTNNKVKYEVEYVSMTRSIFLKLFNVTSAVDIKKVLQHIYQQPKSVIKDLIITPYEQGIQVEIQLFSEKPYNTSTLENGKGLMLNLGGIEVEGIEQIALNDQIGILIKGAGNSTYNVMKHTDPERISIDIMNASLSDRASKSYDMNVGFVERVRVGQFSPDKNYKKDDQIVRVVLDVKKGIMTPDIKIEKEGGDLKVIPQKSVWDVIRYNFVSGKGELELQLNEPTIPIVQYDAQKKQLQVSVPSSALNLESNSTKLTDPLLTEMELQNNGIDTKLFLNFRRNISYESRSDGLDTIFRISMKGELSNTPADFLIVLDPGHGGNDSGAPSVRNRLEKTVNMIVSRIVKDMLLAKGYNVIMTREDDHDPGLYERAIFANDLNADLFLSIHANSVDLKKNPNGSRVHGIEVFYTEKGQEHKNRKNQIHFANMLMEEVLARTGAHKRFVKDVSYAVTRETNMDAALIEMGYLTNYDEEAKLFDPSYQKKMAEGIVAAIIRYIEEYK